MTEWNRERRMQGQLDSALLPESRQLARELGRHFGGRPFHRVYSSPQRRAYESAQHILEGARQETAHIECDSRLKELHVGALQGMTVEDALRAYPDLMNALVQDPERFVPPGGETFAALFDRVRSFLVDATGRTSAACSARQDSEHQSILVLSHGTTIWAAQALMESNLGQPDMNPRREINNLEYIAYDYDGTMFQRVQ